MNLKNNLLSLLFTVLTPVSTDHLWDHLIVWNVGQGQWITHSLPKMCLHLDAGGERFPRRAQLTDICGNKTNFFFVSHFDWDHISFLPKAMSLLGRSCLFLMDQTPPPSKKRYIQSLRKCPKTPMAQWPIELIHNPQWPTKNSNSESLVFVLSKRILISGDSPTQQEKIWGRHKALRHIEVLIVGPHGSYTSTSSFLLRQMPALNQAIVSARRFRYGHPHVKTLYRLRKKKVPVVTTETFGHIIIKL